MTQIDVKRALWAGWGFVAVIVFGWAGWITTAVIGNQTAIVRLTEGQNSDQKHIQERLDMIREDIHEIKVFVQAGSEKFIGSAR
jgi:hypothetical protein